MVDRRHPAGVAPRQIIVDRDQVDATSEQGIEIDGEGGDERLAFTGAHFGDGAAVQGDAAVNDAVGNSGCASGPLRGTTLCFVSMVVESAMRLLARLCASPLRRILAIP